MMTESSIASGLPQIFGPQKLPKKVPISIRVSPETAEYFRSTGKGWQGRINEILKEYIAHHK